MTIILDANERRTIEHDCQQIVIRFAAYLDHGQAQQAAQLFTSDGTWNWNGQLLKGHAEISGKCIRKPTHLTRHIATNIRIDVEDHDHASGLSYFLFYFFKSDAPLVLPMPLPPVYSMGEWIDNYVRTDAGWRLSQRTTARIFHNPGKTHS